MGVPAHVRRTSGPALDHPYCRCARCMRMQESVHDAFAEALTERVRKLRLGDGLEAGVTLGPLITQRAVEGVSPVHRCRGVLSLLPVAASAPRTPVAPAGAAFTGAARRGISYTVFCCRIGWLQVNAKGTDAKRSLETVSPLRTPPACKLAAGGGEGGGRGGAGGQTGGGRPAAGVRGRQRAGSGVLL